MQIWLTAAGSGSSIFSLAFIPSGTPEPFTVSLDFPGVGTSGGLTLGTYYLWGLNDTEPSNCADAEFNLTGVSPGLACDSWASELSVVSPSPATGVVSTPAKLRGTDFYGDNLTYIYWAAADGTLLTYLGNVTTDATGGFNVTEDVPMGIGPGPYFFWGTDGTSDYVCAGALFNVTAGPSLGLTPTAGAGGAVVTVTGTGFSPTDTSITVTGAVLLFPLSCALASGSIVGSCAFYVDGGVAGPHVITGVGNINTSVNVTGPATFTLFPSIELTPGSGPPGTPFTVTGIDFSAYPAAADVSFDGELLTPTGGSDCAAGSSDTLITPDPEGSFVCTFTAPAWGSSGANAVQGDDTSTDERTAIDTFDLQVGPTLLLTPSSGPGATVVAATGSGFSSLDTSITLTGGVLLFPLSCPLSDGSIVGSCAFFVDGGLAGPAAVTGVGNAVGGPADSATAFFTVVPTLTLSPSSGPAAATFTATGADFSADPAAAAVTFDGQLLTPTGGSDCGAGSSDTLITLDPQGGFVCTFSVPAWATVGGNTVAADDTSTGEFTTAVPFDLEVGPSLSLTPSSGAGTTVVEVAGSGFSASDSSVSITGPMLVFPLECTLSGGAITGSCSFDVDGGLAGPNTVTGVGNVGDDPADTGTATFTVFPSISLSLGSGPKGTSFAVTGIDFSAAPAAGAVTFDGQLLTPSGGSDCTAGSSATLIALDSAGSFDCEFAVPAWGSLGANSIQAVDTSTGELTAAGGFTVTSPSVLEVSSTSGAPGPTTFSVGGLAPDMPYYVYLDTVDGIPSAASYNPLGTCTSSSTGTITGCTVTIPSGLAPGTYFVDLYQDPTPPPYIFSVFSFTVAASTSAHPFLPSFLSPQVEILVGIAVLVVVCVALVVSRRRRRTAPPPPSVAERPSGPTRGPPSPPPDR